MQFCLCFCSPIYFANARRARRTVVRHNVLLMWGEYSLCGLDSLRNHSRWAEHFMEHFFLNFVRAHRPSLTCAPSSRTDFRVSTLRMAPERFLTSGSISAYFSEFFSHSSKADSGRKTPFELWPGFSGLRKRAVLDRWKEILNDFYIRATRRGAEMLTSKLTRIKLISGILRVKPRLFGRSL